MREVFLQILNMTVAGSGCIIAVWLLRILLKRQPKIFSYLLWAIVWIRLVCVNVVKRSFGGNVLGEYFFGKERLKTGTGMVKSAVEEAGRMSSAADLNIVQNTMQSVAGKGKMTADAGWNWNQILWVLSVIWLIGVVFLLLRMVIDHIGIWQQLQGRVPQEGYYRISQDTTPFVFGILRPAVYVPMSTSEEQLEYVLAHERVHLRRKDHLIKYLIYLVAVIHWFNPLVWLAFRLTGEDMEMSCDEAVLRKMGNEIKCGYSTSLLEYAVDNSVKKDGVPNGILGFGEGKVTKRVKNILNYKRPGFWGLLLACVIVVGASVMLLSEYSEKVTEKGQEAEVKTPGTDTNEDTVYQPTESSTTGTPGTDTNEDTTYVAGDGDFVEHVEQEFVDESATPGSGTQDQSTAVNDKVTETTRAYTLTEADSDVTVPILGQDDAEKIKELLADPFFQEKMAENDLYVSGQHVNLTVSDDRMMQFMENASNQVEDAIVVRNLAGVEGEFILTYLSYVDGQYCAISEDGSEQTGTYLKQGQIVLDEQNSEADPDKVYLYYLTDDPDATVEELQKTQSWVIVRYDMR